MDHIFFKNVCEKKIRRRKKKKEKKAKNVVQVVQTAPSKGQIWSEHHGTMRYVWSKLNFKKAKSYL